MKTGWKKITERGLVLMMQHKFSKTEQQTARAVSMPLFLSDYDPYRFTLNNKGYLLDSENPDWVGDIRKNWWYDNNKTASHKNGNIIDWLMYMSGNSYSFPEAMSILLEYDSGGDWKQYLRNNEFTPVDYDEELPFN